MILLFPAIVAIAFAVLVPKFFSGDAATENREALHQIARKRPPRAENRDLSHAANRYSQEEQSRDSLDGGFAPEIALTETLQENSDIEWEFKADETDDPNHLEGEWTLGALQADDELPPISEADEESLHSVPNEQNEMVEALEEAVVQSREKAQMVFADALTDEDENTRHRALETAVYIGIPLERNLIEEVFFNDPSEFVRGAAFEALVALSETEGGDVRQLIEWGLQEDPDTLVAGLARDLEEAQNTLVMSPIFQDEFLP